MPQSPLAQRLTILHLSHSLTLRSSFFRLFLSSSSPSSSRRLRFFDGDEEARDRCRSRPSSLLLLLAAAFLSPSSSDEEAAMLPAAKDGVGMGVWAYENGLIHTMNRSAVGSRVIGHAAAAAAVSSDALICAARGCVCGHSKPAAALHWQRWCGWLMVSIGEASPPELPQPTLHTRQAHHGRLRHHSRVVTRFTIDRRR